MDSGLSINRPQRHRKTFALKVFVGHKTALTLGNEDRATAKISDSPNMKDAYREYEKACGQIRQENALLLDGFVLMLRSQRLAPRTISKHRDNVDFFINEFLLYTDATRPSDGIGEVDVFFGDWFIRAPDKARRLRIENLARLQCRQCRRSLQAAGSSGVATSTSSVQASKSRCPLTVLTVLTVALCPAFAQELGSVRGNHTPFSRQASLWRGSCSRCCRQPFRRPGAPSLNVAV